MKALGEYIIQWMLLVYIVSSLICAQHLLSSNQDAMRRDQNTSESDGEAAIASLTESELKKLEAQFLAEPDEYKDLDESLPNIHRAIIKRFYNLQGGKIAPDAIRYINDEESLPDLQQAVFKEFNQMPSSSVPDAKRYTSDAAQETIHHINEEITGQLNNMMFFENEANGDETALVEGDEKEYSDKNVATEKIQMNRGYNKTHFQTAGTVSPFLKSLQPIKYEKPTEGPEGSKQMAPTLNIPPLGPGYPERIADVSKAHLKSKPRQEDIQELGSLVETYKNHENHRRHPKRKKKEKSHHQENLVSNPKGNYFSKTLNSTKNNRLKLPESDKNATKRSKTEIGMSKHNIAKTKREVHQSGKNTSHHSTDELIKRTAIFKDIAMAFQHMAQKKDQTDRSKAKKSSLPKHEKENKNKDEIAKRPVDGGFTPWTDWSDCSETCGSNAIKLRMRVCTNPPPTNGGKDCVGWRFEVKRCKRTECEEPEKHQENKMEVTNKKEHDASSQSQTQNATTSRKDKHENVTTTEVKQQNKIEQKAKKPTQVIKSNKNTSQVVEKMFNEVVHEAFGNISKHKQELSKNKDNTNNTKFTPIKIHSDPGLILSENEIDTIDDAPDTSQLDSDGSFTQKPKEETFQTEVKSGKNSPRNESLQNDNVSKEKQQSLSIDGTYDTVGKTDDSSKEYNETEDFDIALIAKEILKRNDSDTILKALTEENNAETIASFPDTAITNHDAGSNNTSYVQTLENEEKPEAYEITSSKNELKKHMDSKNITIHQKKIDDKSESNKMTDVSDDTGRADKLSSPADESYEIGSSGNDEHDDELNTTLNKDLSSKESKETVDYGNLQALNALVEILAEHEKNESIKKYGPTEENPAAQNGNLPAQNNTKRLNSTQPSNANVLNNTINELISNAVSSSKPSVDTTNVYINVNKNTSKINNDSNVERSDLNSSINSNKILSLAYLRSNNAKLESLSSKHKGNIVSLDNYAIDYGRKRFNVSGEKYHQQLAKPDVPGNGTNELTEESNDLTVNNSTKNHKGTKNSLFDVLKEVLTTINKLRTTSSNSTHDNLNYSKNTVEDSENKGFNPWSAWTECSRTCGLGSKTRSRSCMSKDIPCEGLLKQNQSCHLTNCPVDGGLTDWSQWSTCSASCGEEAYKVRNRSCTNPIARFGGKPCSGPFEEKKNCHLKSCVKFVIAGKIGNETVVQNHKETKKEKGVWGPWSAWTKCSRSCGGDGYAKRERLCLPGKNCTGPRYDTKECGTDPCPVDGGYTDWTQWAPCTPTCGERAYRLRRRYCTNPPPSHGGANCFDSSLETIPCKLVKCPVDGRFTQWSSWTQCSKTCNSTAYSRRERQCTNPEPSNGGKPCEGNATEVRECGKKPCPVDGGVTQWSAWSICPNTTQCESTFYHNRTRSCENPKPKFGGKNCTESLLEKRKCTLPSCPVDGKFSAWSAWSTCPDKCKPSALSHRRRHCNNPKPENGGHHCKGNHFETRPCANVNCPVAGGFTPWSAWSSCSKECDHTSIRSRERYCTNPAPLNNGKPCIGSKFQISVCKTDGCRRDGNFTSWSEWTDCPKCGKGLKKRMRTCSNPPPLNGGKYCEGSSLETVACPFKECKDEGFSQWASYGRCSKSCGGGAKMRRRICEDETLGCDGKGVQLKPCNTHSCLLGNNGLYHPTPKSMCGFNPCQMSKCLGRKDAQCVTSENCQPVFFDKKGNIIESCEGNSAVLTSSPDMICGIDPCEATGCYTEESSKCYVTTACEPLFVDSKGNKLQCRGLLKVPPSLVCGMDPCEGRSCDIDSEAHCVADYSCSPVFISSQDEILGDCADSAEDEDLETEKVKNTKKVTKKKSSKSKKLKQIFQTTEDINSMNTQLKALLKANNESSSDEVTAFPYQQPKYYQDPVLTDDEQNNLEYRLQQFKKRNRFSRPKKSKKVDS